MPKISLKQKYHKYDISFINVNPNISANTSKLRGKTNGKDFTILKPSFPPILMTDDLIKNNNTNNKPKSFPNAFIAYRMALMKEYRVKNCKLPPMGEISKIAKNSWDTEPKHIKDFYESLVKDAKLTYKQNNIQIVLDKHMGDMENNQESDATYDTVVNENLQIRNPENSIHNNKFNFPSVSPADIFLDNSTSINDQEYIKVLEHIIDCLLKS